MGSKRLSVIIPTHNRKEILKGNLEKLAQQSYPAEHFEVVVVDGGSSDGTPELMASLAGKFPYLLKSLRQGNMGPGLNRNLGLRHAEGDIVLFINDDVHPSPTMLQRHMDFHERYPQENITALGRAIQAPEIRTTPFMKWFEPFPHGRIKGKKEIDYRFFWTYNISLKRKFLMENGTFKEGWTHPAYEDVELGYRLHKKGMRLFYNEDAYGYHYHFQTLEGECELQRRMFGFHFYFLWENIPDPKLYEWFPMVHWGHPPGVLVNRLLRHIARLVLFNSLTVPHFFKPFVRRLEASPTLAPLARPLYWRIITYHTRKGMAEGFKWRARN